MKITLKEAKELNFKRKDDFYNILMNQEKEEKVILPEFDIEVDFTEIEVYNRKRYGVLVMVKATSLTTGYGCFMAVE